MDPTCASVTNTEYVVMRETLACMPARPLARSAGGAVPSMLFRVILIDPIEFCDATRAVQ
jgi:hypothetical protein